eukprot:5953408-Prymnesium_polylepis.1
MAPWTVVMQVMRAVDTLAACSMRSVSQQREHVESCQVHDALVALAPRDSRRHAYVQLTQESADGMASDVHACSPLEFRMYKWRDCEAGGGARTSCLHPTESTSERQRSH